MRRHRPALALLPIMTLSLALFGLVCLIPLDAGSTAPRALEAGAKPATFFSLLPRSLTP
ncbi:hypothetical protein [Solilutibacter pythonis]|uniref:hypothetical protein n=1 Tax=Solilutibacter pythonis TaxID=2483112 RepID=UPI00131445C7|nr:hypothetical protein [Lysobacter pythonis]